jgi:hypothetical protein
MRFIYNVIPIVLSSGMVASRAAFTLVSCSAYSSTLKIEAIYPSETSVDFNGLHGVISQKIEPFMTTADRTSNPTT